MIRGPLVTLAIDDAQPFEIRAVESPIAGEEAIGPLERVGTHQKIGDHPYATPSTPSIPAPGHRGHQRCLARHGIVGDPDPVHRVPKPLRRRLGLRPGQILVVREERGELVMTKELPEDLLESVTGIVNLGGTTDEALTELRSGAR